MSFLRLLDCHSVSALESGWPASGCLDSASRVFDAHSDDSVCEEPKIDATESTPKNYKGSTVRSCCGALLVEVSRFLQCFSRREFQFPLREIHLSVITHFCRRVIHLCRSVFRQFSRVINQFSPARTIMHPSCRKGVLLATPIVFPHLN